MVNLYKMIGYNFKVMVNLYKKTAYNINVMRQTAHIFFNQFMAGYFSYFCLTVSPASAWQLIPKSVSSISVMLWLGPSWSKLWFSFAPVSELY